MDIKKRFPITLKHRFGGSPEILGPSQAEIWAWEYFHIASEFFPR